MIQIKTVSLAYRLAEELSKTGVPFRADAWENNPPPNYGVVEVTGQNNADWADGRMVDQTFQADITIYVTCGSVNWVNRIQNMLEELDAGYSLIQHQWLPDIRKTAWTWRASFFAPMEWEEAMEV